MAYTGVKQDFIACCEGRTPSRMPVVALGLEFHHGQAGLNNRETRLDIEKMVACHVRAVRDFDEDWAIIFPDDYIEFEPLGLRMSDMEDHPAMPVEYLPFTRETLNSFRLPDPHKDMRLPIHLEMIRRVKAELGDTVLVMGRIAAPYSTLALIYGVDTLMMATLGEPELVKDNMKFFVEHQIMFGQAQLEAGADLLWLGDCCAGSNFVRAEHFAEFAFPTAAAVAEPLRNKGALLIYHNSENSVAHIKQQIQLPVHAINLGEHADIAQLKRDLQPNLCLMGNFNPKLLRDGAPAQVAESAETIVRQSLPGSRYIFNTAEGTMINTPRENFAAMIAAARRIGNQAPQLI